VTKAVRANVLVDIYNSLKGNNTTHYRLLSTVPCANQKRSPSVYAAFQKRIKIKVAKTRLHHVHNVSCDEDPTLTSPMLPMLLLPFATPFWCCWARKARFHHLLL
jgi:hypothetical protein